MQLALQLAADAVILITVALLLYVAWHDFRAYTIHNRVNLALLALYLAWAALTGFSTIKGDAATALILFLPGLVLWLLRMMGAGDVKLYFVLGLFMGFRGLGQFAILLLLVTVIFLVAIRLASYSAATSGVVARLRQIRDSGKAPYAIIMCSAAIPVILLRQFT